MFYKVVPLIADHPSLGNMLYSSNLFQDQKLLNNVRQQFCCKGLSGDPELKSASKF